MSACSSGAISGRGTAQTAGSGPSSATSTTSTTSAASSPTPDAKPVHVALKFSDGSQFGIGIPIIAYFSRRPTDAKPFVQATKVTVNGTVVQGGWYFETSSADPRYPIEAHYRLQNYWPAHSHVHMDLPIKGLSAGSGLAYDDSLTSDFSIGASQIAVVDDVSHTMTLTVDGHPEGTYPVSLGATSTRTRSGTKVIMEKVPTVCMHDTNGTYYECGIKLDMRVTYDGEYLHAAPWNVYNITHGIDSSNGCTNLLPSDAAKLYGLMEVGDVVQYPNANGGKMQLGAGYGDWNLPWPLWETGGLIATS